MWASKLWVNKNIWAKGYQKCLRVQLQHVSTWNARSQHNVSFRPKGWFHFSIVTAHKFFVLPKKQAPAVQLPKCPGKLRVDYRGKPNAHLQSPWKCIDFGTHHLTMGIFSPSFPKNSTRSGLAWCYPWWRQAQRVKVGSCQPTQQSLALKFWIAPKTPWISIPLWMIH